MLCVMRGVMRIRDPLIEKEPFEVVETVQAFSALALKRVKFSSFCTLVLQGLRRAPGWGRRQDKILAAEDKETSKGAGEANTANTKYFPWVVSVQRPMLYILRNAE